MSVEKHLQTLDLFWELFLVGSPPGINVDAEIGIGNIHHDLGASLLLDDRKLDSGVVLHGFGEDSPDAEECHVVDLDLLASIRQDGISCFDVFIKFLFLAYHPQRDILCTVILQIHNGKIPPIDGDLQ